LPYLRFLNALWP